MASVILGWSKHASRMVRSNGMSLLLSSQPPKLIHNIYEGGGVLQFQRGYMKNMTLDSRVIGGGYSSNVNLNNRLLLGGVRTSRSIHGSGGDYSDCIPPDDGSNAKSSQVKKEAYSGHDDQRHISASSTVTDYERFENWCKIYGTTFSSEEEKYCLFKLYQVGYASMTQRDYAIDMADWQPYGTHASMRSPLAAPIVNVNILVAVHRPLTVHASLIDSPPLNYAHLRGSMS